jgi:hypothetical protein
MAQELHDLKWEDLMSHKSTIRSLQLVSGQNLGSRQAWPYPAPYVADATFLRSWLVYDSKLASRDAKGKFNWNFLIGLLVAGGASAGFWAGMGLIISNLK